MVQEHEVKRNNIIINIIIRFDSYSISKISIRYPKGAFSIFFFSKVEPSTKINVSCLCFPIYLHRSTNNNLLSCLELELCIIRAKIR